MRDAHLQGDFLYVPTSYFGRKNFSDEHSFYGNLFMEKKKIKIKAFLRPIKEMSTSKKSPCVQYFAVSSLRLISKPAIVLVFKYFDKT